MLYEFHVLTIGCFSRNRFWGELDTKAYREPVCTSTLLKGGGNILVDPSLPPEAMAKVLYDRCGMQPSDIGAVFLTHAHGDHFVGLECFPSARWFMSGEDLAAMGSTENARERTLAGRISPAVSGFQPGLEVLPLPGHTPGTAGLLFDCPDGRVAVSGDAVMTRDFFRERLGYYNSADLKASARSIQKLAEVADIIVPGHGNYFPTGRKDRKATSGAF